MDSYDWKLEQPIPKPIYINQDKCKKLCKGFLGCQTVRHLDFDGEICVHIDPIDE